MFKYTLCFYRCPFIAQVDVIILYSYVMMVYPFYQCYVGSCLLSEVYFMCTMFQELALLSSSGDLLSSY
jgi:hypothetical protein